MKKLIVMLMLMMAMFTGVQANSYTTEDYQAGAEMMYEVEKRLVVPRGSMVYLEDTMGQAYIVEDVVAVTEEEGFVFVVFVVDEQAVIGHFKVEQVTEAVLVVNYQSIDLSFMWEEKEEE